jgi:hypothetical protein
VEEMDVEMVEITVISISLVDFFCGPLWKEVYASNHEYEEDPRCCESAQVESAMVVRLIEEISQNSTKGAGEDEGCPEEENP